VQARPALGTLRYPRVTQALVSGSADLDRFSPNRISFVSSGTPEADVAAEALRNRYGDVGIDKAEVIVAPGRRRLDAADPASGDGSPHPGLRDEFGSVGFLMNEFASDRLVDRLKAARPPTSTR